MRSLIAYITLILFALPFCSVVAVPDQTNWLIENVAFRSREGGNVYPGSLGASLTVSLRFVGSQARFPLACIESKPPFNPRAQCTPLRNHSGEPVDNVETGESLSVVFIIDVDRDAEPGTFELSIRISYYIENNMVEEILTVYVAIHPYPQPQLTIIDTYFTPNGYPGSYPTSLVVKMKNDGEVSIEALDVEACFQDYVNPVSARSSVALNVEPGEVFNIVFNNLAIDPYAQPGDYKLMLDINGSFRTSDDVLYYYSLQIDTRYTIDSPPQVDLKILNYRFTANKVLTELRNTGINIAIQSLEPGIVSVYAINVSLTNALFINGSRNNLIPTNIILNYGDVAELVIRGVDIGSENFVEAEVTIMVIVSRDSSSHFSQFKSILLLPIPDAKLDITIVSVDWLNRKPLPGSTELGLTITIANNEAFALRDVYAKLRLSEVFYPSSLIIYGLQIEPYSLAELSFIDISIMESAEPGLYDAILELNFYLMNSDGSTKMISMTFSNIKVRVESIDEIDGFVPHLVVESTFWGEFSPTYVYPGNSRAPLTVVVRNSGIYSVQNIHIELRSLEDDICVLNPVTMCSNLLSPSDSCQAVFYLNLAHTSSGLKQFLIDILYTVPGLGSQKTIRKLHNITIYLPKPEMETGVKLVDYGWLNDFPAYPNSRKAILTLLFTNNELYTVQAAWVNLHLPKHFKATGGSGFSAYMAGPIPSFQVFTLNFDIDIGAVDPGSYLAYVEIEYTIQTYGFVRTVGRKYSFNLSISDPSSSITIVRQGWYGSAPINGTRGYSYLIIVRNREFPSMSKPVIRLELPTGFYDALTGRNEVYSLSMGVIPSIRVPEIALAQMPWEQLQQLLSGLSRDGDVAKGDYMVFMFSIGFEPVDEKLVTANLSLLFIDHWGYEYVVNKTIEIGLALQPPQLHVEPLTPLVYFVNGTAYLDLGVYNPGDGDIYEAYVILIPATGNAIPQGNVRFINKVLSKQTVSIRYTLIYNPITISGFGETYSSSIVFTISVIYRDQLGYLKSMNQTIAVLPKPFIEVSLSQDTVVKLIGEKLVVNGVVINTGLNKARSVLIVATYGNLSSTYVIGDLDPSSQLPFRLELMARSRELSTCELAIIYLDDFNTRYVKNYRLNVTIIEEIRPEETRSESPSIVFYIITAFATIIFLIGVFIVIYRYIRAKLNTGVKT